MSNYRQSIAVKAMLKQTTIASWVGWLEKKAGGKVDPSSISENSIIYQMSGPNINLVKGGNVIYSAEGMSMVDEVYKKLAEFLADGTINQDTMFYLEGKEGFLTDITADVNRILQAGGPPQY